jgi:hypothetical protein
MRPLHEVAYNNSAKAIAQVLAKITDEFASAF